MTNEIRPASLGLSRAFPVILCFLALFFLGLSSACDDDTPTDRSSTPSLSGTVTESAPNASVLIAGATVTLDGVNAGKTTTTNVAGVYSFEGLSDGTFAVRATKVRLRRDPCPITLSGSQTGFVVPPAAGSSDCQRDPHGNRQSARSDLRRIGQALRASFDRGSLRRHDRRDADLDRPGWIGRPGSRLMARQYARIESSDVSVGTEHVSSFAAAGSSHEVR